MKTKFRSFLWLAMAAMISFSSCSNVDDDVVDPDNGGGVVVGDGSEAKPYSVEQAIKNQNATDKWVEGYVVGDINTVNYPDLVFEFKAPFATNTNLLIAAKADETDQSKLISVQLPIGSIREFINLVTNPTKLGAKVKFHGDLKKYLGIAGLVATDNMVTEGYDPKPVEPGKIEVCGDQTTVQAGYKYDFSNIVSDQDFTEPGWQNVMIQGERKWRGKVNKDSYYIQATAHGATANQIQETWVISPAFDVTAASVKMASFETAQAYWKDDTQFEVFVLQCKDGKTVQTKVTPSALATSTTPQYQFVPGTVDLSGFTGKVFIGFRYAGMGGSGLSTTWCLDNFAFGVAPSTETTVAFSSAAVTSVTTGAAYSYAVKTAVVNGKGNTTITATGLPAWASLVDNGDGTATISGTAPATEETSNIVVKATNNNVSAEQAYTLTVVAAVEPGANLVINGGFENWGTGEKPLGWDTQYTTTGTVFLSTDVKHSGNNALKQVSDVKSIKLQQEVPVTEGKKYKISYWYLDNDSNAKTRLWSTWVAGTVALKEDLDVLQDAEDKKYSVDSPDWKFVEIVLTAPATANKFRFEARVYKEAAAGGSIYYDDFSVIEVQ